MAQVSRRSSKITHTLKGKTSWLPSNTPRVKPITLCSYQREIPRQQPTSARSGSFSHEELNVDAVHLADVGLREATDLEIWRYATAEDLILASKDDDFLSIFSKAPTAQLPSVRLGNCRRSTYARIGGAADPAWSGLRELVSADKTAALR